MQGMTKWYLKLVCNNLEEVDKVLHAAEDRFSADAKMQFKLYEDFGDVTIVTEYPDDLPKATASELQRFLIRGLDEYIYAMEDISLAEQLFTILKLRKYKISTAESFTGGGVGQRLVEIPGISEVFFEGLNTYSNLSKVQRLGVSETTLSKHGAVSAEVALEMAKGLLSQGNCQVAVATTGIAGPNSDNTKKPVGLAFISVGVEDSISVYRFNFTGDRESITKKAINQALFLAYKKIKNSGELFK